MFFFFSSRRRHTRYWRDWSSDVCSSDLYHVWWDPDLYDQIEQAAGRIIGFHIDDWKPNTLPHMSRVMMGDGVIELRRIRMAVDEAGYSGPIEVEIFNETYWNMPGDEVLELMKEIGRAHV